MNAGVALKTNKNRIMTVLEIAILVLLCFYAIYVYRYSKAASFRTSGIETVRREQGFDYSIENVSKTKLGTKYYIDVKGWVVEKCEPSKESRVIKVVMKSTETGNYYVIPTVRQLRTDVTRYLYDGTKYDDSGFEAKAVFSKGLNTDISEYEIYVLLKNRNGRKLVDTDTRFNEWIADHQK